MPEHGAEFGDLKRIARAAEAAARCAGACILEIAARGASEVRSKSDHSPVTAADLAAHELLQRALAEILPGVALLSEEAPEEFSATARQPYWVIDPLDGTQEFIRGGSEYCVNVALCVDARPVLGVVHVPKAGASFAGVVGDVAWRVAASGVEDVLLGPVRARAGDELRVFVSRWHRSSKVEALRAMLPAHTTEVRGAALKFTALAAGEGHVALGGGGTKIWDTAAGEAVLLASGGILLGPGGVPLRAEAPEWKNPCWIASANPALFPVS